MPSVAVKLYSVFFKFMLKHRLQNRIQNPDDGSVTPAEDNNGGNGNAFGVTSRPKEESVSASNPTFTDGVATKDIHLDPSTSLSLRIFLPDSCLVSSDSGLRTTRDLDQSEALLRRNSHGSFASRDHNYNILNAKTDFSNSLRRNSYGGRNIDDRIFKGETRSYRGYSPRDWTNSRKMPIMLQFHGGGFVSGSNESVANDFFCRRMTKVCDVIVLGVGYRLAPENKYPTAFEDGIKVLHWLSKQSNLAQCNKSITNTRGGASDLRKSNSYCHITDAFGASMVEPWLAAHGDPSRCVLLGVSCGGNIADYLARKDVEVDKLLDPVKVVAQVLMYPFFIGSVPTHSEIRLANSYFFDKAMSILARKLFLPENEFDLDHPAANPLVPDREPPLKSMPPTLTIVAEHDWMRDRAIAYLEELRKVNVDAPVLEYKDAVHEFASIDMLLRTPQAQACAEDISIWVKKYISLRGHEFSY